MNQGSTNNKKREDTLKLRLKKGFLLTEHLPTAKKQKNEYLWHLSAADRDENEIHEEFTDLLFSEVLKRAKDIIGKKICGKTIFRVSIFGDPELAILGYRGKFEINEDPKKSGMYHLEIF